MSVRTCLHNEINDLKSPNLWRAVPAEFVGTMFLVVVGCGTCLGGVNWEEDFKATAVHISLAFGLIVATMVWCIAHISGGHVNPAVTVGLLVGRKITIVRAVFYIVAQCLGAIAGAGILAGLTPTKSRSDLGMTTVSHTINVGQGFAVEMMITFVLVFTVFGSCDKKRKDLNGSAPLAIGLSVTVCHLFAIKYTGSSMNPARTFGPAVVSGIWTNHWVYWLGPCAGGVLAALLYELLFAANASMRRTANFFACREVDQDEPSTNVNQTHDIEAKTYKELMLAEKQEPPY